jgi:hypothetical protein
MKKIAYACLASLALVMGAAGVAKADTDPPKAWQDVRALVVRFNDAQNAHNLDVIGALMLDSPDFIWSAGPYTARGRDAAVGRLAAMYQTATWSVLPDYGSLNIALIGSDQADVTLPAQFKAEVPGQDTITTLSLVHERAVKTPQGWRIASVAMQPAPMASL